MARRSVGHGLEATVSTTGASLSRGIGGASVGIVAHRLTPRIATLSSKLSTERFHVANVGAATSSVLWRKPSNAVATAAITMKTQALRKIVGGRSPSAKR